MAERLSPNLHLKNDMPAAILFYGARDKFSIQGKEFLQLSGRLGNIAELYVAEDQPHGFFNRSPWYQQTTLLVDQFLTKHGYLSGEPTLRLTPKNVALRKISAEQQ